MSAREPLIDGYGRTHTYLRLAVTDRCNLRCMYCMPTEGVRWRPRCEILTLEEVLRVVRVMVGLGINKVRLTGGEPTVRQDIEWLIARLAKLPGLQTVGMTTNGVLLGEKARRLRLAGLSRLNISLDTLRRERFRQIARQDALPATLAGIDAAIEAGFSPLKINVVVMAGVNEDEILDFVEFTREHPVEVRFIEFMPFPGNQWRPQRYIGWEQVRRVIAARFEVQADEDRPGEVARRYRMAGHAGSVSFISPLSEEFCAHCNRVRLTADGAIKTCLFCPEEVQLRDALRDGITDAGIEELMRDALRRKPLAHPPECRLSEIENRCMPDIGG